MQILRLNKTGYPTAWVSKEDAATLHVKKQILWTLGDSNVTLLGGVNQHGIQSQIDLPPIIACTGNTKHHSFIPALLNRALFRRDNYYCLYCGEQFSDRWLTRDHVVPVCLGGKDIWNNVVTACQSCNNRKGGRTPELAKMELLAIPFTPNAFEYMYLLNRSIVGDQMEYLCARFRNRSRRWLAA